MSEVNENVVAESGVDSVAKKSLKVIRRLYTNKEGKEFYIYSVNGKIRGRNMEASVAPGDVGGYALLDTVFDEADSADLVVEETSRVVNYNTGEKQKSYVYHAHSVDEDGVAYDCIIRPRESSDRQILAQLLAQIGVFIN